MLKKTIKYEDFDGNKREEDHYFNLTTTELTDLSNSVDGGLDVLIEKIIKEKDNRKIYDLFKKIVLMSYGIKSDDGRRFMKSDEISHEFTQTAAYDALMTELLQKEGMSSDFIKAIIPSEFRKQMENSEK